MKPPARTALVLALSMSAILAPTAATAAPVVAAPAPASATATFTRVAQWSAGYVGSITVRNGTAVPIDGWRVEFDLAPGTRITSSYSGVFTRTGDRYTVTNASWNRVLAPGAATTFGWVAAGQATPANCTLNGADCAGAPADYTAPTRPGPLVFDYRVGVTMTWAPSTDDQGPVTYEVYESGVLLRTVTEPRFVVSPGPALPPKVFVFAVRAVDAAGNPSASAHGTIGRIWRGDEIPAAPSGLQVDTPAVGLLRLTWAPAPVPPQMSFPPIAGYEVYLDGELVGQVGRTSIIIPAPAAGRHTFGVRTINAVDQFSPVVQLQHTTG